MASRWTWRPLLPADLPEVVSIESGSYSHPWSLRQFQDSLAAGHHCQVASPADDPQQVLAYAVTMTGADECHLLNITVHREARREGLARWMLGQVMASARELGCQALWLEVRESNGPAIALYGRAGFVTVGRRRGYYPALRGREDALLMTLSLAADAPTVADPLQPSSPRPTDALDR
jgi:ribosomal-protein-alanine N-acetyltransferase